MEESMKGAPGFKKWGDPVDREWKRDFLIWLGQRNNIHTVVETGTHMGGMSLELAPHFESIHTIELSPIFYQRSKVTLRDVKNITQHLGSSRLILEDVLKETTGPILFWLDAHFSGEDTAYDGDPLPEELRVIMNSHPDSLIAIDDMSGVGIEDCPSLSGISFKGWHKEYWTGVVVMHKEGLYSIPPIED
jgi:hypothetical protein